MPSLATNDRACGHQGDGHQRLFQFAALGIFVGGVAGDWALAIGAGAAVCGCALVRRAAVAAGCSGYALLQPLLELSRLFANRRGARAAGGCGEFRNPPRSNRSCGRSGRRRYPRKIDRARLDAAVGGGPPRIATGRLRCARCQEA